MIVTVIEVMEELIQEVIEDMEELILEDIKGDENVSTLSLEALSKCFSSSWFLSSQMSVFDHFSRFF